MVEALRASKYMRDGLPPRDVWLHDPKKDGLLETPLNNRGLVDLDALVAGVKSTVDPSYDWTSTFNDVHHLQWYEARYPNVADENGVNFR